MTEPDKTEGKQAKGGSVYVNADTMSKVDEWANHQDVNRTKAVDELLNRGISGGEPPTVDTSPYVAALRDLQLLDGILPMLRAMLENQVGKAVTFEPVTNRLKLLAATLETI